MLFDCPGIGLKCIVQCLSYVTNERSIRCVARTFLEPHAACFLNMKKKASLIRTVA